MYLPEFNREERLPVLHALIAANPLGLLISAGADGPVVTPVPFILSPDEGPCGTLRAHVARANPHWRLLGETPEALVLFQGPQAYVTPSWYAAKQETGKVVPTWNYVMLEARGRASAIEDPAWLRAQIGALTDAMEAGRAAPWAVSDAPEPFVAAQIRGIVGIEIPVASLVGKWKVSQNRPPPTSARVAEGLAAGGEAMAAMAAARSAPSAAHGARPGLRPSRLAADHPAEPARLLRRPASPRRGAASGGSTAVRKLSKKLSAIFLAKPSISREPSWASLPPTFAVTS